MKCPRMTFPENIWTKSSRVFAPVSFTFDCWTWCREQDLNLHAFRALDPKSSASANSAIPARNSF
jgi:hypothetical protein